MSSPFSLSKKCDTTVVGSILIGALLVMIIYMIFVIWCGRKQKVEEFVDFDSFVKGKIIEHPESDILSAEDVERKATPGDVASDEGLKMYLSSEGQTQRVDASTVFEDRIKTKYEHYASGATGGQDVLSDREKTTYAVLGYYE